MTARSRYIPVIGLEIHLRLETKSKLFAPEPCSFDEQPNSRTSEVTIAEPGALPTINANAVERALRMAMAFNCQIAPQLVFDRKNYFYPDLPKGYQITQYRYPLGSGGFISIGRDNRISLKSIHLEEDSAKSTQIDNNHTGLDFNRAGMPLLEIVTDPTIHSGETASAIVREIARTARYLEISNAYLEEGSLRCDTNISLQSVSTGKNGKRIEIKNLNSLAHIRQALDYESQRQHKLLVEGKEISSETRTYDAARRQTVIMRSKEESKAYRYTPEFDLSPVTLSQDYIDRLKGELPERPWNKKQRMREQYALPQEKADFLIADKHRAYFFETLSSKTGPRAAWSWLAGPVQKLLNQKNRTFSEIPFEPDKLAALIQSVQSGAVSRENAEQSILPELMENSMLDIAKKISDHRLKADENTDVLEQAITNVLQEHPGELERLKSGEHKLTGFFIGQIVKKVKGKSDPRVIRKRLLETLNLQSPDDK